MTDWCTTDWNTLTTSLGFVNWHVHSTSEKDFFDYLSAALTPVIAGLTVLIAYRQWKTSEKDRLFKTVEVYMDCYLKLAEALEIFNANALTETNEAQARLRNACVLANRAHMTARLRLPEELIAYVANVRDMIIRGSSMNAVADAYASFPNTPDNLSRKSAISKILETTLNEKPDETFRKYMAQL
jgi:hypothetical protein